MERVGQRWKKKVEEAMTRGSDATKWGEAPRPKKTEGAGG